jgi:hypothetical protein
LAPLREGEHPVPTVSALHAYPIKSCRALDLKASRFDRLGPLYDRRFMLVDDKGSFLTQRELPRMALISPGLGPMALVVNAPGMQALKVPMTQRDARRIEVQVWRHRGAAEDVGDHVASWFSTFLDRSCRLVRFPDDCFRAVNPVVSPVGAQIAFADGYPALLMSEASLSDLNARLQKTVAMSRFRPNIVVRDCEAFAEDTWKRIRIGDLVLDVVKPCARCKITTVDQITAATSDEPLVTLAGYRTRDNEVLFGQNCVHHGPGSLRVGDSVEILESV